MTPADFDQFATIVRAFAELKGKSISAPAIELYWNAMQHWRLDEFQAAAAQLLRTAKFFPTPADFEQLREASRSTVPEQWARALDHARNLPVSGGYLQEKPTGDAVLDAAVRAIGGYRAIANASERDLQFMGQRFEEHYETTRYAEDTRLALPDLTGGPRLDFSGFAASKRLT